MAQAQDQGTSLAHADIYQPPQRGHGSRIPTLVWLVLLVAALVGGIYVGHYLLLDPINFGSLGGKTTLSESELDEVVATYTYDGETFQVTAREAMAQESSLDAMRNADGSYLMPSVESVIAAARTSILMRDVTAHGISVSDEELAAYVSETFDTDDIASLAVAYTMDEATARDRLRESAAIAKLRTELVEAPTDVPTEPAAPEDGNVEATSADYAAYIIALAGDEWDGEQGIWKEGDGPYATALKDYDVRSDSASYEAAQTAFNVAYQQHSASVTSANSQWSEYVNGLLSKAQLAVSSLVS